MFKKSIFFVAISSICFISCKKQKVDETTNGNNSQVIQLNSYPLSIGNSWKYLSESHLTDSNGVNSMSSNYDSFWEVLSDTIINSMTCSKVSQLDSSYTGLTNFANSYYSNSSDGFYGVAVENNGSMLFLRTSDNENFLTVSFFDAFDNKYSSVDTVFVPNTSLRLLKFPSSLNDIWLSFEYNNTTPDIVKRKWISDTTITTSAGIFNCMKLQMFRDYNDDDIPDSGYSEIYQYFSSKGLIQEEWNEPITFGAGGVYTFHRITKLVQVNF